MGHRGAVALPVAALAPLAPCGREPRHLRRIIRALVLLVLVEILPEIEPLAAQRHVIRARAAVARRSFELERNGYALGPGEHRRHFRKAQRRYRPAIDGREHIAFEDEPALVAGCAANELRHDEARKRRAAGGLLELNAEPY